ncbi:MAG: hypothetical protein AB1779_06965 [Candidatus Thermoplasmatota archaeon]
MTLQGKARDIKLLADKLKSIKWCVAQWACND